MTSVFSRHIYPQALSDVWWQQAQLNSTCVPSNTFHHLESQLETMSNTCAVQWIQTIRVIYFNIHSMTIMYRPNQPSIDSQSVVLHLTVGSCTPQPKTSLSPPLEPSLCELDNKSAGAGKGRHFSAALGTLVLPQTECNKHSRQLSTFLL